MGVALAQDDQRLAADLDLMLIIGRKEHLIARLDLAYVIADS